MAKTPIYALIGAELNYDGQFRSVDSFTKDGVQLKFRNQIITLPFPDFFRSAGLKMEDFDLSSISQEESKEVKHEVRELDGIPVFQVYKTNSKYERKSYLDFPDYPRIPADEYFDRDVLDNFVVFDTEATGLSKANDRLIQLSAIRYENGQPALTYNTYLNPHQKISSGAKLITHITDEELQNAPDFAEIADSFKEFVRHDPLVGYYIKFDLEMVWCAGLDLISGHQIYDAQWYVFNEIPKGFLKDRKLSTIAEYMGIQFPAHNSLGDSFATGEVFRKALKSQLSHI